MRLRKINWIIILPLVVVILVLWSRRPECCDLGESNLFQSMFLVNRRDIRKFQHLINSPSEKLVILGDTIEASKERLSFSVKNTSETEFVYWNSHWRFVKCVNGRWREVQPPVAFGHITIYGLSIHSGETREFNIALYRYYRNLEPGRYLFILFFESSPREHVFVEFVM